MTQPESSAAAVILRQLGRREYTPVWRAMQGFTARRDTHTPDEFWLVEHPPVYTQGLSGKADNILNPGEIPVIQIDRGGQVTYHGPGQMVLYVLLDLSRRRLGVKELVRLMEGAVIDTLGEYRILAARREGAPGVYVEGAKIAALGLRVKRGCSYHGLSLNIDMDLTPFGGIHPCGLKGTPVTQLRDLGIDADKDKVAAQVIDRLRMALGFDQLQLDPSAPSDLEMMQEPDAT